MATGPIETHLHRSFNWENDAPGARMGPRGRSASCGNGLSAQCVRLGSKINHHTGMTQCIYLRFLYAKNRCAQGFQSLPHAGNKRFRKCGEKPRSVDQAAVLHLCPAVLLVKIGLRSEVSGFPVLPKTAIKKSTVPKRKRTNTLWKQSLKR